MKILNDLPNKYLQARKGRLDYVVLEGAHAVKHALRFGAEIFHVAMSEKSDAPEMLKNLGAWKEAEFIEKNAQIIPHDFYEKLSPNPHATGVSALAKKPAKAKAFAGDIVVFLENPVSIFNVGAIIRTVAAFGARSFAISGRHNLWHADALNTARGLHFALDYVENISADDFVRLSKEGGYKIYAMDTNTDKTVYDLRGDNNKKAFIFGTERDGISKELLEASDEILKLPMREGVSSLNMASSVAATLYSIR